MDSLSDVVPNLEPESRPYEELGLSDRQLKILATLLNLPIKGVFSDDTLPKKIDTTEMAIVNYQHQTEEGTHWVAYFNSPENVNVSAFDSLGFPPDEYLEPYLKTSSKQKEENLCPNLLNIVTNKHSPTIPLYVDIMLSIFFVK